MLDVMKCKESGRTAKEAPTGLRIHLGGFFSGMPVAVGAAVGGSCSGGKVCPVPKGSMFPNELLICKRQTDSSQSHALSLRPEAVGTLTELVACLTDVKATVQFNLAITGAAKQKFSS